MSAFGWTKKKSINVACEERKKTNERAIDRTINVRYSYNVRPHTYVTRCECEYTFHALYFVYFITRLFSMLCVSYFFFVHSFFLSIALVRMIFGVQRRGHKLKFSAIEFLIGITIHFIVPQPTP